MKYFYFLSSLFFLTSCGNDLHYEVRNFEEFIPKTEQVSQITENKNQDNQAGTSWIKENFPQNCEWFGLNRIVDGDTIIVKNKGEKKVRIRMIGIDTPESKKANTPIQPFALEASHALKDLLKNQKTVCLLEDEIGDKYDKYSRKLSYVFTTDGKDINGEMLKIGLARGYFYFPFARKSEFRSFEKLAKKLRLGVWE